MKTVYENVDEIILGGGIHRGMDVLKGGCTPLKFFLFGDYFVITFYCLRFARAIWRGRDGADNCVGGVLFHVRSLYWLASLAV